MNLNKLAETADIRKYIALNHELMGEALAALGVEKEATQFVQTIAAGITNQISSNDLPSQSETPLSTHKVACSRMRSQL